MINVVFWYKLKFWIYLDILSLFCVYPDILSLTTQIWFYHFFNRVFFFFLVKLGFSLVIWGSKLITLKKNQKAESNPRSHSYQNPSEKDPKL